MTHRGSSSSPRKLTRPTFAERFCGYYGHPIGAFETLAWRYGTNPPMRVLRPLILFFAPRYFEAESVHLARGAEYRWRHHIVEELELIRVSPLRRGIWRRLGIGLSIARVLKYCDHLVTMEVIETEALRVAKTEDRARSTVAVNQRSFS